MSNLDFQFPDLLQQFSNALVQDNVGIIEFCESDEYCNPPEAPIWMADLSFKPIADIKVGDEIVGWDRSQGIARTTISKVLSVHRRQASIVKVSLASGRSFRCTPDHKWLTASYGQDWFCPPAVGRKLCHIIDIPKPLPASQQMDAAWLGGIFDGEGSVAAKGGSLTIAQSKTHNPEICERIEYSLDKLSFNWSRTDRAYRLGINNTNRTLGVDAATSQMLTNFVAWSNPVKSTRIRERVLGKRMWRTVDEIVSIEPDGEGEVIALTTSTGNYVANGYASKNCNKPLYPRQRVVLKLMFLEELDGYEEDVLNEWIKSSEEGGEIRISPKIRERIQWLRENDHPHFNTVQLVGGRRSGKGHMTGAAIAFKTYKLTQLNNPGAHYGIEPGKDIYTAIIADSLDQAKAYQFKDARNWLLDCKPLRDKGLLGEPLAESIAIATPHDLARIAATAGADITSLATLRVKAFPKNAGTIRGLAAQVVVIDEMAHIIGGESHISDVELYTAVRPALLQFKTDYMLFANSSPWTKQGMFYKIYQRSAGEEALDGSRINYPSYFTLQYPSWEMYKDWEKDKRFTMAIMEDPAISMSAALEEKADPDRFRVEYRAQFGEVVDAFLAPEMVDRMFDPENQKQVLGRRLITEQSAVGITFRYKGHGDPSSRNANFGIAVGHIEEHEGVDPITGELRLEPHVVFDYVNAFFPEDFEHNGGTIDWLTVLPTIEDLINKFRPESWTFDQFESDAPIQLLNDRLRARGLTPIVGEIKATVPHNKRRAQNFKQALYLNRVHAPHPEGMSNQKALDLVRDELKFLQEKNGRVDHPTIGKIKTKDIADCIMEVVDQLIGDIVGGPDFSAEMGMATHSGYGGLGGYTTSQGTPFEALYQGIHRGGGAGQVYVPGRGRGRLRRY